MITKKFRAFDSKADRFIFFSIADLLSRIPEFQHINPNDVAIFVGLEQTSNNELYEGDVFTFHFDGEPLSAELVPCLRDKYRKDYFPGNSIIY